MKAIHNQASVASVRNSTVFNISKIQNESNSQLALNAEKMPTYCVQYFKDTK